VDNSDLKEKAKELTEEFNKLQAKMKELEKENYERMKQAVGTELPNKYEALKKEKEEMEKKRNKLALRVQKLNDKIIPIGRRLMKPYLEDEFDDYDTLRLEGDEIVGTIFNHLDDAEKRLRERFKKIIGN
jgi:seryl-tRNA synthetase